jgi:hypothetical protein
MLYQFMHSFCSDRILLTNVLSIIFCINFMYQCHNNKYMYDLISLIGTLNHEPNDFYAHHLVNSCTIDVPTML